MRASDLPSDAKHRLADAIREQIGDAQYEKLVSAHGEDNVLNIALQGAQDHGRQEESRSAKAWWIFGVMWLVITLIAGAFTGLRTGLVLFFSPLLCVAFFAPWAGNYNLIAMLFWLGVWAVAMSLADAFGGTMLWGFGALALRWIIGKLVKE